MQEAENQAHIHVKQPVEGDLPPLLRENIGPQLSGLDQKQSGAVHAPVVEHRPLFYASGDETAQQAVLLGLVSLSHTGNTA